jgi:hypothetical protein
LSSLASVRPSLRSQERRCRRLPYAPCGCTEHGQNDHPDQAAGDCVDRRRASTTDEREPVDLTERDVVSEPESANAQEGEDDRRTQQDWARQATAFYTRFTLDQP